MKKIIMFLFLFSCSNDSVHNLRGDKDVEIKDTRDSGSNDVGRTDVNRLIDSSVGDVTDDTSDMSADMSDLDVEFQEIGGVVRLDFTKINGELKYPSTFGTAGFYKDGKIPISSVSEIDTCRPLKRSSSNSSYPTFLDVGPNVIFRSENTVLTLGKLGSVYVIGGMTGKVEGPLEAGHTYDVFFAGAGGVPRTEWKDALINPKFRDLKIPEVPSREEYQVAWDPGTASVITLSLQGERWEEGCICTVKDDGFFTIPAVCTESIHEGKARFQQVESTKTTQTLLGKSVLLTSATTTKVDTNFADHLPLSLNIDYLKTYETTKYGVARISSKDYNSRYLDVVHVPRSTSKMSIEVKDIILPEKNYTVGWYVDVNNNKRCDDEDDKWEFKNVLAGPKGIQIKDVYSNNQVSFCP